MHPAGSSLCSCNPTSTYPGSGKSPEKESPKSQTACLVGATRKKRQRLHFTEACKIHAKTEYQAYLEGTGKMFHVQAIWTLICLHASRAFLMLIPLGIVNVHVPGAVFVSRKANLCLGSDHVFLHRHGCSRLPSSLLHFRPQTLENHCLKPLKCMFNSNLSGEEL